MREFKRFAGVLIIILAFLVIYLLISHLNCKNKNKIPSYPLYPNATQVYENMLGVGSNALLLTRTYQTQNSPEEVVQFYEEYASCELSEDTQNMLCIGSASPSGEFVVYIPIGSAQSNTNLIEFIVEVRWKGCSFQLEF